MNTGVIEVIVAWIRPKRERRMDFSGTTVSTIFELGSGRRAWVSLSIA